MFKRITPKRRKCLSKWEEVSPAVPKLGLACSLPLLAAASAVSHEKTKHGGNV